MNSILERINVNGSRGSGVEAALCEAGAASVFRSEAARPADRAASTQRGYGFNKDALAPRLSLFAAALIFTSPAVFAEDTAPRPTVSGVVVKAPRLPRPETCVYADCLLCFVIRLDHPLGEAPTGPREILAVFLGMKKRVLLKPSRLVPGERVLLTLTPFFHQPPSTRQLMRVGEDLAGVDTPMFWVDDWQSRQ